MRVFLAVAILVAVAVSGCLAGDGPDWGGGGPPRVESPAWQAGYSWTYLNEESGRQQRLTLLNTSFSDIGLDAALGRVEDLESGQTHLVVVTEYLQVHGPLTSEMVLCLGVGESNCSVRSFVAGAAGDHPVALQFPLRENGTWRMPVRDYFEDRDDVEGRVVSIEEPEWRVAWDLVDGEDVLSSWNATYDAAALSYAEFTAPEALSAWPQAALLWLRPGHDRLVDYGHDATPEVPVVDIFRGATVPAETCDAPPEIFGSPQSNSKSRILYHRGELEAASMEFIADAAGRDRACWEDYMQLVWEIFDVEGELVHSLEGANQEVFFSEPGTYFARATGFLPNGSHISTEAFRVPIHYSFALRKQCDAIIVGPEGDCPSMELPMPPSTLQIFFALDTNSDYSFYTGGHHGGVVRVLDADNQVVVEREWEADQFGDDFKIMTPSENWTMGSWTLHWKPERAKDAYVAYGGQFDVDPNLVVAPELPPPRPRPPA